MHEVSTQFSSAAEEGIYILRLYVTGNTPQSSRAIGNLKAICERYLQNRYTLTVIDLYAETGRAQEDQIIVAPTLVRQAPLPVRRLIGDLSDTAHVLKALDIHPADPISRGL